MTRSPADSGATLASVLVAMVLFAFCVTAALKSYHRGTVAVYSARVEQEAVAVLAWYTAEAQAGPAAGPCEDLAENPPVTTTTIVVPNLAGYDFVAEEFRAGWCSEPEPWPPDACIDTTAIPPTAPPECKPENSIPAERLVVTVEMTTNTGQTRTRELSSMLIP